MSDPSPESTPAPPAVLARTSQPPAWVELTVFGILCVLAGLGLGGLGTRLDVGAPIARLPVLTTVAFVALAIAAGRRTHRRMRAAADASR